MIVLAHLAFCGPLLYNMFKVYESAKWTVIFFLAQKTLISLMGAGNLILDCYNKSVAEKSEYKTIVFNEGRQSRY